MIDVTPELRAALPRSIRKARQSTGMSQRVLALRMGVGRDKISLFERGRRVPGLRSLLALGEGMGIPAWRILRHAQRQAVDDSAEGDGATS